MGCPRRRCILRKGPYKGRSICRLRLPLDGQVRRQGWTLQARTRTFLRYWCRETSEYLVETYGTEKEGLTAAQITEIVKINFDCRPGALARDLNLREPKYNKTAAYCHFGREPFEENGMKFFSWEDCVDLSKYASMSSEDVDKECAEKKEEILSKWVD